MKLFFGNDETAGKAFSEWQDYQLEDHYGELFFKTDAAGTKIEKPTCSWTGERRGLGGADWWIELPYEYQQRWSTVRNVAIKVLSQTSTESAAERHFSAVEVIQPKMRAALNPESLQKRSFLRAEIHGELASRGTTALTLLTVADVEAHEASGKGSSSYHDYNAVDDGDSD
jgi:hypothetical protein